MPVKETVATSVPEDIHVFELSTSSLTARVINYGATLTHLYVPDKDGVRRDVVLGFDKPSQYVEACYSNPYFGAIVGRTCNRITHGHFFLNDRDYNLPINDPPNHIHGGLRGFDKKYWRPTILKDDPPTVRFEYTSPDGEEGYPGELTVSVTYTLTETDLVVDFSASLTDHNPDDLQTIVNMTAHPYFNLSGFLDPDIKYHTCQIPTARGYLELTENQVPTGRVIAISEENPCFDFAKPKTLNEGLLRELPHMKHLGGYDNFFLLHTSKPPTTTIASPAAIVRSPTTGITLSLHTNANGFQLYTGNFLDGSFGGKSPQPDGTVYKKHAGLCLEPSAPIDAVNHAQWRGMVVLGKGEEWSQTVIYRFGVAKS